MADTRMPDSPRGSHGAAGAAVPEMPAVPADTLVRGASSPYVLMTDRHRHAIGWQDTRRDGPCFVVTRLTVMDTLKVIDRFPLTEEGWARAWAALVRLEPGAAPETAARVHEINAAGAAEKAEGERRAELFSTFVNGGGTTEFKRLQVQVAMATMQVYTIGRHDAVHKTNSSRLLGPLAGAQAIVTVSQAGSSGSAMVMPMGMTMPVETTAVATRSVADAAVVFPDGSVHTVPVDGNAAVREAQSQAVQFNALAGTAVPARAAAEDGSGPASRLRTLQELLDAGLLTEEEYRAKRAEVIAAL